jgi:hypothetical protein
MVAVICGAIIASTSIQIILKLIIWIRYKNGYGNC